MIPLPKRLSDTGSMASWLNQLRQCVQERTPRDSHTVKMDTGGQSGFTAHAKSTEAIGFGNFQAKTFTIMGDNGDWWLCTEGIPLSGELAVGTVKVAKPWSLRPSHWPSEYTASGQDRQMTVAVTGTPGFVWTEQLRPQNKILDENGVDIGGVVFGGPIVGIKGPDIVTNAFDENDDPIEWLDINVNSLTWIRSLPLQEVEICIRNTDGSTTTKFMLVVGGAPYSHEA